MVRIIAILKLFETVTVFAAGLAALKLLDPATLDKISTWSESLPGQLEQSFIQHALAHLSGITPHQASALGAGAFFLAAIFLMEGIGLWLERAWAEWLSIIATAIFIPLEVLELLRHATAPKTVALIVNVLVVVYLIVRIVARRRKSHAA